MIQEPDQSTNELHPQLAEVIQQVFGEEGERIIWLVENDQKFNRALGAVYGAFLGDALGSHCEFETSVTASLLDRVMEMPGEGTFQTDPGQLTDDSELALELSTALLGYSPYNTLEEQMDLLISNIAKNYVKWLGSRPFDIGHTCRTAFQKIKLISSQLDYYDYVLETQKITQQYNKDSESNGSLMRITPMAVFSAYMGPSIFKDEFILKEVRLTHSNSAVLESTLTWISLLEASINRSSDYKLVLIYQEFMSKFSNSLEYPSLHQWIASIEQPFKEGKGWAKVAWCLSVGYFSKLANQTIKITRNTYSSIVKEVIKIGGDTDTNANIVGGMVGSVVGFKRLPHHLLCKMLQFNPQSATAKLKRPKRYEPKQGMQFTYDIFRKFERVL